jgi:isopenicillin N synthase-like dioxygenase
MKLMLRSIRHSSTSLPLIDFSKFLNGTRSDKLKTSRELVDAFKNVGFVYLLNHGISAAKVESVFSKSKQFFEMPQDRKDNLAWESPESNRGYVSQGNDLI